MPKGWGAIRRGLGSGIDYLMEKQKEQMEQEVKAAERKKLVLQSTVAGITLGAVAVAAVTLFASGSGSKR